MSKILRLLTVSLLLASIMIASFAGMAFAAGHYDGEGNPDCPDGVCPNPDGPLRDGEGLQLRYGGNEQHQ